MGNEQSSPATTARTPAIPFRAEADPAKFQTYTRLADFVANREEPTPRLLVYTDIDQDYDDLLAIIFLSEMHRMGAVEIAGVIANHHPAVERAWFLRTVLDLLGLPDVPVGVGKCGVEDRAKYIAPLYYGLKNATFIDVSKHMSFESANCLATRLAEGTGKNTRTGIKQPLTVLLLSTLQDIGELFEHESGDYLKTYFKKFVSQGGYTVENHNGRVIMQPTPAANNDFHPAHSKLYTQRLADLNLPSDAWSKFAATAARMPASFMQSLFKYGPIGRHLSWQWLRQEFKFFWDSLHMPFLPHLNVEWYFKTRLGLDPSEDKAVFDALMTKYKEDRLTFADVRPLNQTIAYDCCAAVGAVGDDFMEAFGVLRQNSNNRSRHRVFGQAADNLGGINAPRLAQVMEIFLEGALISTYRKAENKIPSDRLYHETVVTKLDKLGEEFLEPDVLGPLMTVIKGQAAVVQLEMAKEDAEEAMVAARKARMREDEARYMAKNQQLAPEIAKAKRRVKASEVPLAEVLARKGIARNTPGVYAIPYEAMYQDALKKQQR